MIDLYPFAGFPVAVLGLGPEGLATARALVLSGAEVWAWDEDAEKRAAAAAAGVPLRDLAELDWREPVSLALEHDIPHHGDAAHPLVAAARGAGCEIVVDAELLARAQREPAYAALVSRGATAEAMALIQHVLQVSGRETEWGGLPSRPILDLHPLDAGAAYLLAMPPGRADLTVSITFDAAVVLDLGDEPWPPYPTRTASLEACRWVFHRQTGPKAAILNVDNAMGRRLAADLGEAGDQIVIPVSAHSRAPGGVYCVNGRLFDDIQGAADLVAELPIDGRRDQERTAMLSAAAYATAVALNTPRHAAMASLLSFFVA